MSNTARNFKVDPASVDGLDDLLNCTGSEAGAITVDTVEADSTEAAGSSIEIAPGSGWTLKEAATNLGISLNTVRKRLRDGSLEGRKVLGINGPEWCITPPLEAASTERGSAGPASVEPATTSKTIEAPTVMFAELLEELRGVREELQSAHWRNGYLEAQLEMHKEQVKLLPDYQQKATEATGLRAKVLELETDLEKYRRGYWARFWSWFTGK